MGFNARLFDVVLYSDSYDFDGLENELKRRSGLRHYAYIIHDKCLGKKGPLKSHIHVAMRMNNSCNSDNVAKWFCASPSQVEKCKGRWADMLAYLTHANAPDKFQYDPKTVVSNFDWFKESKKAGNKGGNARLDELLEGIMLGNIRKFNFYEHLTVQEYALYKPKLNSGFEYRIKKIKGVDKKMESIYVWGGSGTGKTTWAKEHAKDRGMSVYISSGSNDVLDDYEGQDCIILDDLRPSCMGLSDLLKMLDNNTSSTIRSRYYNKVLECKLIIITTTKKMDTFFSQVFENESEPLKQLERRCGTIIEMTKDRIRIGRYQAENGEYSYLPGLPNVVLMNLGVRNYTDEEMLEHEARLLGSTVEAIKIMRAAEATGDADKVQAALDLFKKNVKAITKNDKSITKNDNKKR